MKLTHSAADTEEIIQETFIRLWMGRDRLIAVQSLNAWIYTIAANECYRYLKKKNSRETHLADMAETTAAEEGSSTFHALQLKEVRRLIAEAISLLPERRRKIYQLSRDEGMKIPEIAATLHLSPNTVKNTLVISLAFIRKYLEDKGHPY